MCNFVIVVVVTQAIWDKVWKAVHRPRLCLTEEERKASSGIWIPSPPRELWDVQGGVPPSAWEYFQWLVLKLTGDIALASISLEGIHCDVPKCLLSESTVFTYLPVFKIFVKSYKKHPSNDQIWTHSIYYPQCHFEPKYVTFLAIFLVLLYLFQIPFDNSKKSSALSRN